MPKFTFQSLRAVDGSEHQFTCTETTARAIFDALGVYNSGDKVVIGRADYGLHEVQAHSAEYEAALREICG